jgi:hypothetical protein
MLRTKRSWPGTSTKPRREADVDGDAAALLLFEAVSIDAGKGFDQRSFAVIDVPGGADDDRFHTVTV